MRALALHPDVLVVTSALLQVNCVVVRGAVDGGGASGPAAGPVSGAGGAAAGAEAFAIDSPVLPDELDALPALLEQAGFPSPSGLLATHGDWDHLLARLSFPGVALGVAESTAERLSAQPGAAQRELRSFDEGLLIERPRPLTLGSVQALSVPGRCEVGGRELELHDARGHTADGMAILIGWAGVLVAGDYLSTVETPTLDHGGDVDAYLATLERMRGLIGRAERIVPGHGPILERGGAMAVLEEDVEWVRGTSLRSSTARMRRRAARRPHPPSG